MRLNIRRTILRDNHVMPKQSDFWLECMECDGAHPATVRVLTCPKCDGLFDMAYRDDPTGTSPRLPLRSPDAMTTLGEGDTPLIELRHTGNRMGLGALHAKLEFASATGSFKDRGSAVLMSAAVEEQVDEFVEDSSGNAGASLSAYAAAAGIKAHVFAPASAAKGKLDQIAIFGSDLRTIPGPDRRPPTPRGSSSTKVTWSTSPTTTLPTSQKA